VIRPRRGRWVAETFAVLVFATFAGCAWIAPGGYGAGDRLAIVLVGAGVALVLHRLAAVRVIVTEDGLEVVNPLRRRRIPWWQVRGVRLERGDPWLILQLVDSEAVQAMGVQGSDGDYARQQAMVVARHVVAHSRADKSPDAG
jgi:hypothetical protein